MRTIVTSVLTVHICMALTGCAPPGALKYEGNGIYTRTYHIDEFGSGEKGAIYFTDPRRKCPAIDNATDIIVRAPKHGQAWYSDSFTKPLYGPDRESKVPKCNTLGIWGRVLGYRSNPGYVGPDDFVYQTDWYDGILIETVQINVVK